MNKKQKEILAKAEDYKLGTPITAILIIPSGRYYRGAWGRNGFDHMYLIGENAREDKYYYINKGEETDVLTFFHLSRVHSVDIPHHTGSSVRICFDEPVIIDELLSSITPKSVSTLEKGVTAHE